MKIFWKMMPLMTITCLLSVLAGCSGGGGGGTPPGGTTSVSGVVADGYLQGAYVFLDKNGTKKWDATMPKAVTDANGAYKLDDVSAADLAKYPIVVEVPGPNDPLGRTQAQDKDSGPVPKPYTLQAPPGKPEFVSPLTTLVQQEVEKSGVTPDQAEAAVKNNLGLSASTSLFKDFKDATGKTQAELKEYTHAANVAMVVATAIAENKEKVEQAVKSSGVTGDQSAAITKLILETISQQVTTIVQQVLSNVNTTTGVLDPTKIANIVTNSNVSVSTTNADDLTQQLKIHNATSVPVSFKDAISGTGLFNIDSWQDMVNNQPTKVYEYQQILMGTQASDGSYPLSDALFNYTNSAWGASSDSHQNYFLTSTGWKLASSRANQGAVTVNADGSIVWKHKTLNYSMSVASTAKDISGVSIQPLVAPNGITVNSTAVFPTGSNAYKQTFTPLQTTYRLSSDWSAMIPNGQGGLKPASTLAEFITACQDGATTAWFGISSSTIVGKFTGTGTTTGSTGTLKFYPQIFGMTGQTLGSAIADSGTWKIEEPVAGYQVLVLTLPLSIKQHMSSDQKSPIFGVANGTVLYGNVEYQGVPKFDNGFSFNKTAFDSILNNFVPGSSTPPPPTQNVSYVSIEGYVYASGTTSPIAGAVVSTSLDSKTATTDAKGHFSLQTKTPANYSTTPYTITITKTGYTTFSGLWNWGDHPVEQRFNL